MSGVYIDYSGSEALTGGGGPVHDVGCDEVEDGKAGWAVVMAFVWLCSSADPLPHSDRERTLLGLQCRPSSNRPFSTCAFAWRVEGPIA